MQLILLSGQSFSNKSWIEGLQRAFSQKYPDTEALQYSHWEHGGEIADVELETQKFTRHIDGLTEDYSLFAKSIGCVIFLNSLPILTRKPQKVTLIGVPNRLATEKGYDFTKLKTLVTFPVSIFQKRFDPQCSLEELPEIAGGQVSVNEYECIGEENNNHHYANTDTLLGLL